MGLALLGLLEPLRFGVIRVIIGLLQWCFFKNHRGKGVESREDDEDRTLGFGRVYICGVYIYICINMIYIGFIYNLK